jgi:hypothetical protein
MLVSSRRRARMQLLVALFLLLASSFVALAQQTFRTITGTVTDGHEPLRGAVVQLQNPANNFVESYVTDDDGRYVFKHADSHTDFRLWATYRGHKSEVHSISMFDSRLEKVVNIVCGTH